MTTRPPVQLWQLVGTSLLCGIAVAVTTTFPGNSGELISLATWGFGLLLISVGAISLIRHSNRFTRIIVPVVSLMYCAGTISLLSSNMTILTSAIAAVPLLFMTGLSLKLNTRNQTRPSRVAIKVTAEAPSSESEKRPLSQDSESSNHPQNEHIDSGLEHALLSRLSVENEHEENSNEPQEPIGDSQSIQFQPAEQHILQRYERGLDPEGREWLEGTVRVDFLRNQRTAVIHIPFWPAFQIRPQVNSELLDGPHLKIDVKTVERWGIRLELTRRAAGLDPDSAELAFFVTTESKARGAA